MIPKTLSELLFWSEVSDLFWETPASFFDGKSVVDGENL